MATVAEEEDDGLVVWWACLRKGRRCERGVEDLVGGLGSGARVGGWLAG